MRPLVGHHSLQCVLATYRERTVRGFVNVLSWFHGGLSPERAVIVG